MMTLLTMLDVVRQLSISTCDLSLTVSKQAASMIGTSANLKSGDIIKLHDLMFGNLAIT